MGEDLKLFLAVLAAGMASFGGSKIAVAVILTRLDQMAAQRKEDLNALAQQRAEDKDAVNERMDRFDRELRDLYRGAGERDRDRGRSQ